MKLIEMAKHHSREAHLKQLLDYANNDTHIMKLPQQYDGKLVWVESAHYMSQEEIDKYYTPEDEMTPFVSVQFVGDDDTEIFNVEDFVDEADVYELRKIL